MSPLVVCHLCLNGPYTEGLNYQENLLPKYHARQGHTVYQIVTQFESQGINIVRSADMRYRNEYGVEVVRIKEKGLKLGGGRFYRFPELYDKLVEVKPDILFIHDIQFLDTSVVAKYLRNNKNCRAFADNHCDYLNGVSSWQSKHVLHGIIWRHCAHQLEPYVEKFYGVLPARVDILTDLYKLPDSKCELLVMGADDELVERACLPDSISQTRNNYGIKESDFLVVTGGKINRNRPEIIDLMRSVGELASRNVKLIVFGAVSDDLRQLFEDLIENNENITFIGWIDPLQSYELFAAADIVVFPGLHSVMWEQAVAVGAPCAFRDIEGFHHVDLGGNAIFLHDVSADGLKNVLMELINDKKKLSSMKQIAIKHGMKMFSYDDIARRCIK